MNILLENVGKRYLRRWIFRGLSYEITQGARMGITGFNGSGKSTLLKILTGALAPSEGTVRFSNSAADVSPELAYRQFAFAAPYTDLIEEMTLREFLGFHVRFRPFRTGIKADSIVEVLGNQFDTDVYMKSYSSGMKQRVRLVTAMFTEASVLVLDEPTSNLDAEGKQWYSSLLGTIGNATTVVIASNEAQDMEQCTEFIHIPDHLPSK